MSGPVLEAVNVSRHFNLRRRRFELRHRRFKPRRGAWFPPPEVGRAVDGVSLSVQRGETLGIVGESGSGKTTLSRLLLMLDTPTAGEVRFKGRRLADLDRAGIRAYRRAVQPVFQNPFSSLNPRMRVRRIVGEPLIVGGGHSRSQVAERVDQALERVGLSSRDADKFPQEFSGGQRQRIAIARALASEPEIMILDEAVSSQDISIRAQILNLLKDLQGELGIGYVFIAHDLATVRYLSHHVAVMYQGQVVENAPCDEIYQSPRHPYTRGLLEACLPGDPDLARQAIDLDTPVWERPPGRESSAEPLKDLNENR